MADFLETPICDVKVLKVYEPFSIEVRYQRMCSKEICSDDASVCICDSKIPGVF